MVPELIRLLAYLVAAFYTGILCILLGLAILTAQMQWAWSFIPHWWARGVLFIFRVKVSRCGPDSRTLGPAIFVMNHQSFIDMCLVPHIMPNETRYIAKKELAKVPLWGAVVGRAGLILIDRKDRHKAILNIQEGMKSLPEGYSVVVFPEGTRSIDGEMKRFKMGAVHMAIASGLPVVPIGMDGAKAINPGQSLIPRPGVVEVTVGEPIITTDWKIENAREHLDLMWHAVNELHLTSRRRYEAKRGGIRKGAWCSSPCGDIPDTLE
jgi:1-acyl-sn-glycerol-3-phosphate acyltransferase